MRGLGRAGVLAALLMLVAPAAQAADPVVGAAGDIACDPSSQYFNGGTGDATHCVQRATSDLLLTGVDAVLPLGDTQYEEGALSQFQQSYEPSWGRLRSRTRPAIGNHEYYSGSGSPRGSGYFDYFNGVGNAAGPAGDRAKGYYSFDLGSWHLVALNANCAQVGGCDAGSVQEQWLRADLAAHPASCTLAYWHQPRFSSGEIGNEPELEPLWQALYDGGAELVLNGHDHNYERFAPQDAKGAADAGYGLRQFVVGTGGKELAPMGTTRPNSEVRNNSTFGVLKLSLRTGGYDWAFAPAGGAGFSDNGTAPCHGKPPPGPPRAVTGSATGVTEAAATLTGSVSPRYAATSYRFAYGPTATYGKSTSWKSLGYSGGAYRPAAAQITGLTPGATYHYRLYARNSFGTVYGVDRTFRAVPGDAYSTKVLGTPGLAAYWRLGESSGTEAVEQLGAYPGSYRGGFSLGQPGALVGQADKAVRFDGTSGEMAASSPGVSTTGTVEGWFKWESGVALMRDNSTYSGGGWILAYDGSGTLKYRVAGKTYSTTRATSSLRDGQWHHVVLTKNGATVVLYIDGAAVHTGAAATDVGVVGPWHVMRNGAYSQFTGGLADEVAIYGSALDATTVREHYAAGR